MKTNNQLINDILAILSDGYETITEGDYISDTYFLLTDNINNTGSFTCNSFEAKESVNNYSENYPYLIEEVIMHYKNELGMHISELYFTNIEQFQVLILISVIGRLLYNYEYFSKILEEKERFESQKEIDELIDILIDSVKEKDINELF